MDAKDRDIGLMSLADAAFVPQARQFLQSLGSRRALPRGDSSALPGPVAFMTGLRGRLGLKRPLIPEWYPAAQGCAMARS